MSATASESLPESTPRHERYLRRARSRDEPSQTRTLRQEYARKLRGAWQRIRAAAREGIVENDALALESEALVDAPRRGQLDRDRIAQQVDAVRRWITRAATQEIVQPYGRNGNEYIERAYLKGVEDARTELRALGIESLQSDSTISATALQLPAHEEQIERLLEKNLSSLEGLTEDTAEDLSRELSDGLAAGDGPKDIASTIADRIESIGLNRATVIARTELMDSYNTARLKEWEEKGVTKVGVLIAADACPECQAYNAGEPYQASKAYGNLPKHPRCRCSHHVWTGDNN